VVVTNIRRVRLCYLCAAVAASLALSGCGGGDEAGSAGEGDGSGGGSAATGGTGSGGAPSTPYVEPVETVDLNELPEDVPTVSLEIDEAAIARLDQDPYTGPDEVGDFVDADGNRYAGVDVSYRGAYALQNLIQSGGPQRNWKIKFSRELPYRTHREWNFTYQPHLREKLAYDLFRFATVKVPSARHVRLEVNGADHGLYLEYEDPDNKSWLREKVGDDSGDLYKAAYDLPGEPQYFATLEYLGDQDEDYLYHYQKKLNNNDDDATDYSLLRAFLQQLNSLPDAEVPSFLEANFDVTKFIRYLVVSNFVSNWDGYPHRPKNFWLYEVRAAGRWLFIPWDNDATFQLETFRFNGMGVEASVFYQFDQHEPYGEHAEEGTERPLVRRMMVHDQFRDAYVDEYRSALSRHLERDYLLERIDALESLLSDYASDHDSAALHDASEEMREFVRTRTSVVTAELDQLAP